MGTVRQLRVTEEELERQNAELSKLSSALEVERLRYKRLFERAPLAHLTTDSYGRIIEANAAAGALLQVDPRFLVRKPLAAFFVRSEVRRFRRWLLEEEKEERPVFRMQRRASVAFDAELRVYRDDPNEFAWVIRDVTEERQAEQRIWELNRELEQRVAQQAGEFATLYDQSPIGLAIVAKDDSAPRLNPRAREILGDAHPFDEEVRRAFAGIETRGETVRFTKDDIERALEITVAPLRGSTDEVIGAVVMFDDITVRERIERADREFVTNASHQLRTPITAIGTAVAALRAGAADSTAERALFLDHLESEADRLARIVDAMLVLARVQRSDLDAPLTLVPLAPLFRRVAAEALPATGVTVTVLCEDATAVIAHPALIQEALANVLANAVAHTNAGSVLLSARAHHGQVEIEVADTGSGMTPEIRERAFERFFGETTNRRSAGLGLAIAAAAVQASRGTIHLESEPGAGTRIRIRLPGAPMLRA